MHAGGTWARACAGVRVSAGRRPPQVPEPSDDEESKEEDELLRSLLAPTPRDATPATASAPASEPRSLHTSRTKRLVIGAVVRAAAPQTPAAEPAARSPTRSAALAQGSTLKLARSLRGAKKGLGGTSAMFRMDAADDPATGMQAARESSLTRGYEALRGAERSPLPPFPPSPRQRTSVAPSISMS